MVPYKTPTLRNVGVFVCNIRHKIYLFPNQNIVIRQEKLFSSLENIFS
jgi:hypothetical protein